MELEWFWWGFAARVWMTQLLMLAAVIAGLYLMVQSRQQSDPVVRLRQRLLATGLLLGPLLFFVVLIINGGYLVGT